MAQDLTRLVFDRRHRLIPPSADPGDASTQVRQFDAVLMSLGFKLSGELMGVLSQLDPGSVIDQAVTVLDWAREATGAHRAHNVYFIDFPDNVPDTLEFWAGLLSRAVHEYAATGHTSARMVLTSEGRFALDLLSLPGYGTYQHTYAEMLEHHQEFEPLLADRMTILHLGRGLDIEAGELFAELAGSAVPLSGDALDALRALAGACIGHVLPAIPVRENLAVVNAVRVRASAAPQVSTVTDVLRLYAELSGSDVTLATPPKFGSLPRAQRRVLLTALQGLPLDDVPRHGEEWKRAGERLHPHELDLQRPQEVFAVARGQLACATLAAEAELCFHVGAPEQAARVLRRAPGQLWRAADRLLRMPASPGEREGVLEHLAAAAPHVSGRVLLSVREHLQNRVRPSDVSRVFRGRTGKAYVAPDTRPLLDEGVVRQLLGVIDAEVMTRLPDVDHLVVDSRVLGAAVPLSGKGTTEGLGVWPRGSVSLLDEGEQLRFFFYWKQARRRTDYDLSCLLGIDGFAQWDQVSYTRLSSSWAVHSGDLTDAANGATEFIDVSLEKIPHGAVVVPQLLLFNAGSSGWDGSGESYDELEENLFGFMTRDAQQRGRPFEPRTVRMKTVLRGEHRIMLPVLFFRGDDGRWYAKWAHLGLTGRDVLGGYRVEDNRLSTGLLARATMARDFLQVRYLVDAWHAKGAQLHAPNGAWERAEGETVRFIGVEQPDPLPEGTEVFTLGNLGSLVPA